MVTIVQQLCDTRGSIKQNSNWKTIQFVVVEFSNISLQFISKKNSPTSD